MPSHPRHDRKPIANPVRRQLAAALALACICAPGALQAEAGWTDYVSAAELIPTSKHYYELRLPVSDNPSGCREKNWFYQNYDAFGSDKMFEVLLESIKSRIPVRVYVTGNCNINGYAEFSSVGIAR